MNKEMTRIFCTSCGWHIDNAGTVRHCRDGKLWTVRGTVEEVEKETTDILKEIKNGKFVRY